MPRFNVTAPDGSIIPVDAPAGATEQDAIAFAASTWKPTAADTEVALPGAGHEDTYIGKIPGERSISKAEPEGPGFFKTLVNRPLDVLEAPIALAANAVSGIPIYLSGALGPDAQKALAGQIQYQPRGQFAKDVLESTARTADAMKIPNYLSGGFGGAFKPRVPSAMEASAATRNALTSESKFAKMAAQDAARGPQIDALKDAQRMGFVINPVDANPSSIGARAISSMAGNQAESAVAKANLTKPTEVARKEMGLPENTPLDKKSNAFEVAKEQVAGPYQEIRKLSVIEPDEVVLQGLEKLRPESSLIGGGKNAKAINALVDDAISKVGEGLSGAQFLDNIQNLRAEAKKVYNNKNATPKQLAAADTQLSIASQLETMLDSNISNPRLLGEWRAARTKMAQIYAYEGATNRNTGLVDISKIARITEKNHALTGDLAALGRVGGNFPELFTNKPAAPWYSTPFISRGGPAGATGAAIGGALGGWEGALYGSIAAAPVGWLGSKAASNRLVSPEYQRGLGIRDYRPTVNNLAPPPQAPIPQNQAIVPYQPEVLGPSGTNDATTLRIVGYNENGQPIYKPNEKRTGPNFTMPAQPTFGNRPTVFESQRGLPNEVPKQVYQAQKNAELAQEFRAAAERKPASGGQTIEVDPVTGKMTLGAEGTAGMTPNTQVIESTGKSLASAAEKVTAGKMFDMTAEEKIAWKNTRADLAEVASGLEKLDDKAVAAKMMDRKWASDALDKAREKAAMFDELSKRIESEQAKRDAAIKRDQMLDLAAMLEDNMRAPRPVSSGGQGPKTREFRRNQLAQDRENKNALRIEIRGVGQKD
jgi:hypothetical protein